MTDQRPEASPAGPRVVFAQRVLDAIVRGALLYPGTETGEALIGLVVPQDDRAEPDIYVLDTIRPGDDAVREWGMFEQGDDWQGDVLHWLHVNWQAFREQRRTPAGDPLEKMFDAPLAHVGDWHKQPGDMIAPSGGDAETARLMIADRETPVQYIVVPIVTLYPLRDDVTPVADANTAVRENAEDAVEVAGLQADVSQSGTSLAPDAENGPGESASAEGVSSPKPAFGNMPEQKPNTIVRVLQDVGWIVRVDCWYMSKHVQQFVAVSPEVWADDRLPELPPLAWHLAHPRRFDQEYGLLADAGYMVDVVRWDADGQPPYEICFSVYKRGSSRVILIVTPVDYPVEMPAIRLAPLVPVAEDEDVFEKLYQASEPVLMTDLPEWEWDTKRTLIELVWHMEQVIARYDKQDDKQDGGAQ